MSLGEYAEEVERTNIRNAWVRELCGIGGKYREEGAMVNFDIEGLILRELGEV